MRKTFQLWLLIFIAIAFAVTLTLSFLLQTQQSLAHSETLIRLRLYDAREQIVSNEKSITAVLEDNHTRALTCAEVFAEFLNEDGTRAADSEWMERMLGVINVDELHVIDKTGVVVYSTEESAVGCRMFDAEQSTAFLALLDHPGTGFAQELQPRGYVDDRPMQYAGFSLTNGQAIAQIGFDADRLFATMELADIQNLAPSMRIGGGGQIVVAENGIVVSDGARANIGRSLTELGVDTALLADGKAHLIRFDGEMVLCMLEKNAQYQLVGMIPQDELYRAREQASGFLIVTYLFLFLAVFMLISWLLRRVVINGLYRVNDSLRRITAGDLEERVEVMTNPEFQMLSSGINATVDSLKHAIAETTARMDAELEFAKSIQFSCVPNVFPPYPNRDEFELFATMDTAREVGGDFYDFFFLRDACLGFVIADVSGKGIGAAMYMMRAKTQIKNRMLAGGALDEVVCSVNNDLCEGNDTCMFVTAFVGVCDFSQAQLSFVSAGHNPPLMRHAGGAYAYMSGERGLVLGGRRDARYHINTQPLFVGDRLFLYTDGVTEAVNRQMELFGEVRLAALLNDAEYGAMRVSELLPRVREQLDCFAEGTEQADDITMLAIDICRVSCGEGRLQLPANTDRLDEALAFVNGVLARCDVEKKTISQVDIAFDELFTNVASYAYGGGAGMVTIDCCVNDGVMRLTMTDCGTPYNPLEKPDPDVTLKGDVRPIGGLGIYLAKKLMDNMRYDFVNGLNQVTLIKKLG